MRKTISTSLASAFGFVIALVWANVVNGGLSRAGIQLQPTTSDWGGWAIFVLTAAVLTVVMVVFIVIISRWGMRD